MAVADTLRKARQPDLAPLAGGLAKLAGEIVPRLDALQKRVEEIARTPLPPQTVARGFAGISKREDGGGTLSPAEDIVAALARMSDEERTLTLIKAAHANPISPRAPPVAAIARQPAPDTAYQSGPRTAESGAVPGFFMPERKDTPMNPTLDTLDLVKGALRTPDDRITKTISTGTGLVAFDLQAPAKNLYPVVTPIRNVAAAGRRRHRHGDQLAPGHRDHRLRLRCDGLGPGRPALGPDVATRPPPNRRPT